MSALRCSQDVVRLRATLPDGSPADRRGWPAALSSQDNPFEAMVRGWSEPGWGQVFVRVETRVPD